MFSSLQRMAAASAAALALAFVVGCAETGTPTSPSVQAATTQSVVRQAESGFFELCKDYVGTVGPAVTFNITVDDNTDGDIDSSFSVQLANGQCQEIWQDSVIGSDLVTVTEVVPAGFTASFVKTTVLGNGTTTIVDPPVSSNTTSGSVATGDRGFLVVFRNTGTPPPPPGNEGCTPGYWKQDQHFDSWPAPYTPNTLFSSVFENAFPGMTLLQVLQQGGGGLNALGRHTVAALLNAASTGVEYPLTTAQVISGFNAVFPVTSDSAVETLHLRWAGFNEAGCPLN
jgi:hypothetical protein